jgi:DNA-binding GntR family transcriptional regulator
VVTFQRSHLTWEAGNFTVVLEHTSLTDSLTNELRKQIISGEIEPGQRLAESWVAKRFAVARPTAKAGIDRLVSEGLLRRGRHQSAVIPALSAKDVDDLYFSREPIESHAVVILAKRSDVPADAERALARMSEAAKSGEHAKHTEADIALHRVLVKATGSPRLDRMHKMVMGESQLCIAQVRQHAGVDLVALTAAHSAILDAIRAGNPDEAAAALRRDLDGCRATLLADIEAAAPRRHRRSA